MGSRERGPRISATTAAGPGDDTADAGQQAGLSAEGCSMPQQPRPAHEPSVGSYQDVLLFGPPDEVEEADAGKVLSPSRDLGGVVGRERVGRSMVVFSRPSPLPLSLAGRGEVSQLASSGCSAFHTVSASFRWPSAVG